MSLPLQEEEGAEGRNVARLPSRVELLLGALTPQPPTRNLPGIAPDSFSSASICLSVFLLVIWNSLGEFLDVADESKRIDVLKR